VSGINAAGPFSGPQDLEGRRAVARTINPSRTMLALRLVPLVACVTMHAAELPDVILAAGKLAHHRVSNELFQVDELWIRVAEDTEFHRWLSQGINREVTVSITTQTAQRTDQAGTRILTGKLVHLTAPNPTPTTVDVVGQLPPGNLPMVHIVFVRDEALGTLGAVTLQTSDGATVSRLQGFDDADVSIVIAIK
jgi:hypothetical protein